jgi:RNA recognition motif-containing protein
MNIFVGNLTATVTADDLRQLFGGYGTIVNAIVMRDTATGMPLGYGHVYLVPEQDAYEAIINLHNTPLNGSRLSVRECVYRSCPERRVKRQPWHGPERRVAGARRHNGYDNSPSSSRQQHTG